MQGKTWIQEPLIFTQISLSAKETKMAPFLLKVPTGIMADMCSHNCRHCKEERACRRVTPYSNLKTRADIHMERPRRSRAISDALSALSSLCKALSLSTSRCCPSHHSHCILPAILL